MSVFGCYEKQPHISTWTKRRLNISRAANTFILGLVSMLDSSMLQLLYWQNTHECCADTPWMSTTKNHIEAASPHWTFPVHPPPVSFFSLHLPCISGNGRKKPSLRCTHFYTSSVCRCITEQERVQVFLPHALTQHLCRGWFQMNKAEYQVAHLYAMHRKIDQSITDGGCWITNALRWEHVQEGI